MSAENSKLAQTRCTLSLPDQELRELVVVEAVVTALVDAGDERLPGARVGVVELTEGEELLQLATKDPLVVRSVQHMESQRNVRKSKQHLTTHCEQLELGVGQFSVVGKVHIACQ